MTRPARLVATLALAAALGAPSAAQTPPDPRPVLRVRQAERPVALASLDVRVVIHGLHAETTQTLTFHNPNDRVLEGELEFPLPDGATVNGYAIDVDGQLADAVVVAKQKARVALETEIRRGADPGLAEQVRGNLFRTRVYPIPARGQRTVRLSWVSELTTRGEEAAYHLPLPWDRPIGEAAMRVEVVRSPVAPEISGGFGNLAPKQWSDRWVAEARFQGVAPVRDLLVRLPRIPALVVQVEPGAGDEAFFAVTDLVPERPAAAPAPRRVAVAWDASGSREDEAIEREIAFLSRLLDAWPAAAVDLVVFRDRAEPPVAFAAGSGRSKLVEALRRAPRDGGTSLASLSFARGALPRAEDALWLLFSDGIGTVGEALPAPGDVPVWAATGATVADRAFLRHVAGGTGGQLVDLVALDPLAAVAAVASPRVRLVKASGSEKAVADLQLVPRADPSRVTVTGRLLAPEVMVTLAFGDGTRVVEQRSVAVRRADAARAGDGPGPVATAWAQGRAEALGLFPDRNAAELLSLGRRFGLVSAGTSLLVLETLEQHIEHGVEPSPARRGLRERYLAAVTSRDEKRGRTEQEQIERVAGLWAARVAWWEKEHDVPPGWQWSEPAMKGDAWGSAPGLPAEPSRSEEAATMTESAPRMSVRREVAAGMISLAKTSAGGVDAAVVVKPWDPETPWLVALRKAKPAAVYETYLAQRKASASPAFFLDCAGFFLKRGDRGLGLRILSNLAELRIDDPGLLRVFAWRLEEAGEIEAAVAILEKVLRLRPEDGQSRRDLALALGDLGEARGSPGDVARAIGLLWDVVRTPGQRTPEIEIVALMELNRLASRAERRGWSDVAKAKQVDARLRRPLDLDLRVSLSWDADMTDVDLHVYEPTREHAFYGHPSTAIGGLVSRDVTTGYGPEEYVLRRAVPGPYSVKAHYYGSSQQTLVGPATVTATVFTNWGRPDEKRQVLTLRLDKPRGEEQVGVVTVGSAGR